ncbi:MAG: hypothetical protein Q7V00_10745 [Sulfurimicrobium sp.]|nr:hypothetical protein [Sulfurimicrobium sp.]MDO9189982.1 hypothetical protein [Sulfurimicrobium sp.]MDP2198798.1 hypothetical protein [Sulfurimicrobium sp.]
MTTPSTFLERMQPIIEAMPDGPDKEKLLALVESQDTVERVDVHPKDRARAMRRLLQIDTSRASSNGPSAQARSRGKTP